MIEFLLILIVLFLFGGLMLTGLGGFFGLFLIGRSEKHAKKALANASAILDETFAGAQFVTYKVTAESLPFEVVVKGALERGYKIAAQEDVTAIAKTLVFEKV